MGEYIEYEEKTNPESIAIQSTMECNICAKLYPNRAAINAHYKQTHEKFITGGKNTKSPKNVMSRVKCHECGETKAKQSLKYHLKAKHFPESRTYESECDLCSKSFLTYENLRLHKKQVHANIPTKCEICNKEFSSKIYERQHFRYVHKRQNKCFRCNKCNKEYSNSCMIITA